MIKGKQLSWLLEKAGDGELGCAKQMIYLVAGTHMLWLGFYLLAEHREAIKPYIERMVIGSILSLEPIAGDNAYLLGPLSVVIMFFLLLLVYTKWRQAKKLTTRTHLNALSVSIISYCQYRVAVSHCVECNIGILEFIANYLLAAVFLFALIPAKWINDYLVIGFFVIGALALFPIYLLFPLLVVVAHWFYRNNADVVNSELRMLNKWLHRTLLTSRR